MTYARILILIICLFLLLSPILLSPPRLPAEFLIIDQWVSDEQSESVSGGFADTQWISLESDGDLIYVDDQGRIGARTTEDFYLEHSDEGFFNTSQYHDLLVKVGADGGILETLDSNDFPVILDRDLMLIDSDGFGLKVLGEDRRTWFTRRWASPVLEARAARIQGRQVIFSGLLDGRLFLLDQDGTTIAQLEASDESRFQVLYGASLIPWPAETDPPLEELILVSAGGFDPAVLTVHRLLEPWSELPVINELARLPLGGQPYGPVNVDLHVADPSNLYIDVWGVDGSARFRLNRELDALEILQPFNPDILELSFFYLPDLAPLQGSFRGTGGTGEFYLSFDGDRGLFARSFPFSPVIRISGSRLFLRGGGLVSSYILEEG
jgi:hypothetical protein